MRNAWPENTSTGAAGRMSRSMAATDAGTGAPTSQGQHRRKNPRWWGADGGGLARESSGTADRPADRRPPGCQAYSRPRTHEVRCDQADHPAQEGAQEGEDKVDARRDEHDHVHAPAAAGPYAKRGQGQARKTVATAATGPTT